MRRLFQKVCSRVGLIWWRRVDRREIPGPIFALALAHAIADLISRLLSMLACTFIHGRSIKRQQRRFMLNLQKMCVLSCLAINHTVSTSFAFQTRYCVKWKSSEGKLVLKITDNTTVRMADFIDVARPSEILAVSQIQDILLHLPRSIRGSEPFLDAEDAKQTTL